MTHSVASYIAEALEDLDEYYYDKFIFNLRDRREKPWFRRCEVNNKSRAEIGQLLVSKFTEDRVLQVTLDLLKHIDCNQVATELLSKTKTPVDVGDPVLRKTTNGDLDLEPSEAAQKCAADNWPLKTVPRERRPVMKTPGDVEKEAKARVLSEGGDTSNRRLVLSRFSIQFGQYKGQTFKWLLENDLSYTVYLVAEHQKERKRNKDQSPHLANKDSLTSYATAYADVLKEVRSRRRSMEAKHKPVPKGKDLFGFGSYKDETLKDLYESKDEDKISYVEYLRSKKSSCTKGSQMEAAIKYILKRDQTRKRQQRKRKLT